jgi:hypothetical protein
MKIDVTTEGDVVLKTTNRSEREPIIDFYTKFTIKGIKKDLLPTEDKPKRAYKKRQRGTLRTCEVSGCSKKARGNIGIALHMYREHGVSADGTLRDTYNWKGKEMKVSSPVMQTEGGKYFLIKKGEYGY